MLVDRSDIVRALVRFRDVFDPRSTSLMVLGGKTDPVGRDPFRGGFIAGIEERDELVRRLRRLENRKRQVVCLWYMGGLPVTQISKRLRVSRMHCYRLRNQALEEMAQTGQGSAEAAG